MNTNKIRIIYLELLNKYKLCFSDSITKLNELVEEKMCFCYQTDISIKLIKFHLKIVEFNLEFANDKKRWSTLF